MKIKNYLLAPQEPISNEQPQLRTGDTPTQLVRRTFLAYPLALAAGVLFTSIAGVASTLPPVVVSQAIDGPLSEGDWAGLGRWIVVLIAVYIALIGAIRIDSRLNYLIANYTDHFIRMQATDRLLNPRGLGGKQRTPGELLSIATSDTRAVAGIKKLTGYPIVSAVSTVASIVFLFSYSWILGLMTLLGAPVVAWSAARASEPLKARTAEQQQAAAFAAGSAADLVDGVRIIKGLGAEEEAIRRYVHRSENALDATLKTNRAIGWFDTLVRSISEFHAGLIGLIAALLAFNDLISIGELVASIGLAIMAVRHVGNISSDIGGTWASSSASAKRVLSVAEAPVRFPLIEHSPELSTDLVLPITISKNGLTFEVLPGELVVIRSTPAQTVDLTSQLALIEPAKKGTITLDGRDITNIDLTDVRSHVTVSPHTANLFEGSIWDNVTLGSTSEEDFDVAIEAASATEMLKELPQGAKTQVGEAGLQLSGGQRQRIALARALAAAPPVLVLNDPTSAVDSITENIVASGVKKLRRGKSTLVFTQSPAWSAVADRIINLSVVDHPLVSAEDSQ